MKASFANFARDRFFALAAAHIWLTALLIFSGADWLEPLAATWFWAPLIAMILTPDRYAGYMFGKSAGQIVESWNRSWIYAINWFVSVTIIPWLLWNKLYNLDVNFLHPAREAVGKAVGLGGQTGLVLVVASVLSLLLLFADWRVNRSDPRRSRRSRRGR